MKQRMLWGSAPAAAAHDEPDWGMYGPCSAHPPHPFLCPSPSLSCLSPGAPGTAVRRWGRNFPGFSQTSLMGLLKHYTQGPAHSLRQKAQSSYIIPSSRFPPRWLGNLVSPGGLQRPSGPDLRAADGANPRAAEDLQGLSRVGASCLYRVLALTPHTTQASTHR